jgi:hypothetical protein
VYTVIREVFPEQPVKAARQYHRFHQSTKIPFFGGYNAGFLDGMARAEEE